MTENLTQKSTKRIVIFASGGGSNFRAIHSKIEDSIISAEIVLVVSNNPTCGAIEYAKNNGISTIIINSKGYPDKFGYLDAMRSSIRASTADLVVLAGFMKLIPKEIVKEYTNKIINIHPALLPAFGGKGLFGMNVHKAVIESGAKYSGPTVHFVNEEYDKGSIIAQRIVSVFPDDSPEDLAKRVLIEEHKIYPEVVKAICENRIKISKNKTSWIEE
ncbi:MAG: phosphoribosylglycinamide formyltransferase [Candidatus Marinimicrobia bacterium]|nr:phosphoribosylglycinamide formyltransferase [Candidatus Neomarinimicrobiota bacterium]MBL7023104.1 phosphoribosylglycinamide formyltransferase [Candidatus Neomarinimicrobiota bacterium]MBL7109124.1 phosphoribosylglycinamide formyltransferase [Candidatus Neomarinimicrobiota bacterium]